MKTRSITNEEVLQRATHERRKEERPQLQFLGPILRNSQIKEKTGY